MEYIIPILIIAAGALLLFAGWRIYKKVLFLLGFVIGAVLGAAVVALYAPSILLIIIGALMGALFGAVALRILRSLFFIALGATTGIMLANILIPTTVANFLHWIVIIAMAIVCAMLALFLKKPVVIGATALTGAALIITGANQLLQAAQIVIPQNSYVVVNIITMIVLALIGAIIQILTGRKRQRH